MSEVKKSINGIQVVGTIKEKNLKVEEATEREIGSEGNRKKVTCRAISKSKFSNPAFVVESNGMPLGIDIRYSVLEKTVDSEGNVKDNPKFKELLTILNDYVCGETRVKADAVLAPNEYVDKDFEYRVFLPTINIDGMFEHMTSSGVPEEDIADGDISGVISKITHEVKNEEETGRLIIELYTFDYKGATTPFTFTVEADIANDVENFYSVNDSVRFSFEAKTIQHGETKVSTGGFGRRESNRTSGYTTTEYSIFRGDEPFEEGAEFYVDGDTITIALNEREIMKTERIAKRKENASNTTTAPTRSVNGTSVGKANPFAKPTATPTATKKAPF